MKTRDGLDFYPTPEVATIALLEREEFKGDIWEPACGDGAISRVLKDFGYEVYSTDITYYGYGSGRELDFLTVDWPKTHPGLGPRNNIITNPPFKLAKQFVLKALECTDRKVAMFLRLAFLESQNRKGMFENTPLSKVYVFSKRLTLYPGDYTEDMKKGSGSTAFAWFVWDHAHKGPATLHWI